MSESEGKNDSDKGAAGLRGNHRLAYRASLAASERPLMYSYLKLLHEDGSREEIAFYGGEEVFRKRGTQEEITAAYDVFAATRPPPPPICAAMSPQGDKCQLPAVHEPANWHSDVHGLPWISGAPDSAPERP